MTTPQPTEPTAADALPAPQPRRAARATVAALVVLAIALVGFVQVRQDGRAAKEPAARALAQEVLDRWAALQVRELTTEITDAQLSAAGIDPGALGVRGHAASAAAHQETYEPGTFAITYDITNVEVSRDGIVHVEARQNLNGRAIGEPEVRQDGWSKFIALAPADPWLRLVLESPDIRNGF
jgi:hypothetical protein